MQTLTQVFTRALGGCDNHRCHNKKKPIGNRTGDVNDVMPGSDGLGFLVILNKSSELRFEASRSELIFSDLGEASAVCGLRGAHARWLGQLVESWRWTKSQHRKIVSDSPRVEKNLNLKKVIKVSYLNQESRQCFAFFRFLCVWTFHKHYEHFMHVNVFTYLYVSRINIWLCYSVSEIIIRSRKIKYQ